MTQQRPGTRTAAPRPDRRLCVAPMMDWTDRYCRYLLRLISRRTLLYTEMVTTGALLHGDPDRLLTFAAAEHPVALQLGGSDPGALAHCARLGEERGYDEIDLNLGCPSDRVRSGRFGACLMAEPVLVAECVAAMAEAVRVPITVKTRIGIDDRDDYPSLARFVERLAGAGCGTFIVHARKAWLQGLSPRQNREIPPLRHDRVYRLKRDFPQLEILLNGGVTTLAQAREHLCRVDGVMIGREAYHNPWVLAAADREIFGEPQEGASRRAVVEAYLQFAETMLADGVPLQRLTRPLLGLFRGAPGARAWRRHLSEHAHRAGAGVEVIREALERVPDRRT